MIKRPSARLKPVHVCAYQGPPQPPSCSCPSWLARRQFASLARAWNLSADFDGSLLIVGETRDDMLAMSSIGRRKRARFRAYQSPWRPSRRLPQALPIRRHIPIAPRARLANSLQAARHDGETWASKWEMLTGLKEDGNEVTCQLSGMRSRFPPSRLSPYPHGYLRQPEGNSSLP